MFQVYVFLCDCIPGCVQHTQTASPSCRSGFYMPGRMDEGTLCSRPAVHHPSALAFPKYLPLFSMPSPSGTTRQALLQTCVPPAATQDTRGQRSARVLCCSLRTRIESCEPRELLSSVWCVPSAEHPMRKL